MATRTRYRRGSSSAYGYGGAWLRAWFGSPAPAASPNAIGGAAANNFRNVQQAASSPAAAPYQQLQAALSMGGQVLGRSANGAITYVQIGGMVVSFNTATGAQIGQPVPATATGGGAAPTGGGAPTAGGAAGDAAAPTAAGAGPTPRVGQTVSAQTANGVVTGVIESEENGVTTVRWSDGTVATYGADGQLMTSTPPTGQGGAGAGTEPGDEGEEPIVPVPPSGPNEVAAGSATDVSGIPGLPPPPAPLPTSLDENQRATELPFDTTSGYMDALTAEQLGQVNTMLGPAAPAPTYPDSGPNALASGSATDVSGIAGLPPVQPTYVNPMEAETGGSAPIYSPPPAPAPAPAIQQDRDIVMGGYTAPQPTYVPPPPPPPQPTLISTQWGWLTPSQLETMFASTYNAPPEMAPTPPPAPPSAPSPAATYQPPAYNPYGASLDPGFTDAYVAPPPPPQYGTGGSGFYS